MDKKILLLKKKLIFFQKKLNIAEMEILNGRLITYDELISKSKISNLRKKLKNNISSEDERELIEKQIRFLTENCTEKNNFQNTYKLRSFLRKEIDNIKIELIEYENKRREVKK